ncbi:hypothetical protein WA026_016612 [Henosepilachna vigintioctopunctata]|uniref:Uncharacterized protein n=1 Tax=Henosepilachna vigintioctopunctata TaxID=420089 RepID=A0AAW1VHF8_9CUCU
MLFENPAAVDSKLFPRFTVPPPIMNAAVLGVAGYGKAERSLKQRFYFPGRSQSEWLLFLVKVTIKITSSSSRM